MSNRFATKTRGDSRSSSSKQQHGNRRGLDRREERRGGAGGLTGASRGGELCGWWGTSSSGCTAQRSSGRVGEEGEGKRSWRVSFLASAGWMSVWAAPELRSMLMLLITLSLYHST
jgi:hypothetical protein